MNLDELEKAIATLKNFNSVSESKNPVEAMMNFFNNSDTYNSVSPFLSSNMADLLKSENRQNASLLSLLPLLQSVAKSGGKDGLLGGLSNLDEGSLAMMAKLMQNVSTQSKTSAKTAEVKAYGVKPIVKIADKETLYKIARFLD